MITKIFTCKMCGKEFESCGTVVYYCPDCRIEIKKQRWQESNQRQHETWKKYRPMNNRRHPSKSLDEFMHELNEINTEREKSGLRPLTYGQYTVTMEYGKGEFNGF